MKVFCAPLKYQIGGWYCWTDCLCWHYGFFFWVPPSNFVWHYILFYYNISKDVSIPSLPIFLQCFHVLIQPEIQIPIKFIDLPSLFLFCPQSPWIWPTYCQHERAYFVLGLQNLAWYDVIQCRSWKNTQDKIREMILPFF